MRTSFENPAADAWYEAVLNDPASFPFRFSLGGRLIRGFPDSEFALENKTVREENGRKTA